MTMIVEANLRAHHWKAPHGSGSFRPNGKIQIVGEREHLRSNPTDWESEEGVLAARLFVGFNVGDVPTHTADDLVRVVRAVRERQGRTPDSSFLVQKGIYTSRRTGRVVEEDGAQVIILNLYGASNKEFTAEMSELAEAITHALKQEEVVVEIQQGGITKKTFGVVP